jgi:hypothetical protein
MANFLRTRKRKLRVNERDFPFVVQIAVPDGGFGCMLDAVNAWHRYSNSRQRRGPRQIAGEQEVWSWCFDGLEIAKSFRQRFGGEIVPATIRRRTERRRDGAPQKPAASTFGGGAFGQKAGDTQG